MLSQDHNFIFIHIPKCGGTSIEHAFNVGLNRLDIKGLTGRHNKVLLQHLKFSEIENQTEIDISNYFKFTFVRNPWSREVSSFLYEKRFVKRPGGVQNDFKDFLKNPRYMNPQHAFCQFDYITNSNGEPSLDFIGKFENLQQDFDRICNKIGVPQKKLPHSCKSNFRNKPYVGFYNSTTKKMVAEKYAKDIEYFGYKFGE
jgi:hypothetical protein